MPRTTPEETFAEARAAIERGDWDGFFACLAPADLTRIAENGVNLFLARDESSARVFTALCAEHAVPEGAILALRTLLQQMAESASVSVAQGHRAEPGAMLEQSRSHKRIVDEYRKTLKNMLKVVPDLPRFTAALERATRAAAGGGSVSSQLFVGETLADLSVTGDKALATRRTTGGDSEDVGFVRRKGLWSIRLFAQRPRNRSR